MALASEINLIKIKAAAIKNLNRFQTAQNGRTHMDAMHDTDTHSLFDSS